MKRAVLLISVFLLAFSGLCSAAAVSEVSETDYMHAYFTLYDDYLTGGGRFSKGELMDLVEYYLSTEDVSSDLNHVGRNSGKTIGTILSETEAWGEACKDCCAPGQLQCTVLCAPGGATMISGNQEISSCSYDGQTIRIMRGASTQSSDCPGAKCLGGLGGGVTTPPETTYQLPTPTTQQPTTSTSPAPTSTPTTSSPPTSTPISITCYDLTPIGQCSVYSIGYKCASDGKGDGTLVEDPNCAQGSTTAPTNRQTTPSNTPYRFYCTDGTYLCRCSGYYIGFRCVSDNVGGGTLERDPACSTQAPTTKPSTTTTTPPDITCSDGTPLGQCSSHSIVYRCISDGEGGTRLVHDTNCKPPPTTRPYLPPDINCSDGTPLCQCSSNSAGFRCVSDDSGGRTLENDPTCSTSASTTQQPTTSTSPNPTNAQPSKPKITLLFIPIYSDPYDVDLDQFNSWADSSVAELVKNTNLKDCPEKLKVVKLTEKCRIKLSTDHVACDDDRGYIMYALEACAMKSGVAYDTAVGVFDANLCGGEGFTLAGTPMIVLGLRTEDKLGLAHEMGHRWKLRDEYYDDCRCSPDHALSNVNCLDAKYGGADPAPGSTSDYCAPGPNCAFGMASCLGHRVASGGRCIMSTITIGGPEQTFCPLCSDYLNNDVPALQCGGAT